MFPAAVSVDGLLEGGKMGYMSKQVGKVNIFGGVQGLQCDFNCSYSSFRLV